MRLKPDFALAFFILAVLCAAIFSAWDWPVASRFFVISCAVPGIVFLAIFIVRQILQSHKGGGETISEAKQPVDSGGMPDRVSRDEVAFFAWVFGFLLTIWLIGFQISALLFTFFYLRFKGRRSWMLSFVLTISVAVLVTGVFTRVLHISWPESVVEIWLGL